MTNISPYKTNNADSIKLDDGSTIQQGFDKLDNVLTITKEPTGFTSPSAVIVTGDASTRKVALTGTTTCYWRGVEITNIVALANAVAHGTDTAKIYYLSYNGITAAWSETPWTFDLVQIAFAFYDATLGWLYQRESHGFIPYQCHQDDHFTKGSYKTSGGDISGVTKASTTATERRPLVSSMVHNDEDLPTTQAEIATNSYTQAKLTSTGIMEFLSEQTDIVKLSTARPYYNSFSTPNWSDTLMPSNSVMSIWLVSIPTAADTNSQKVRFIWLSGQWITKAVGPSAGQLATAVASELARNFNELNLGNLRNLTPEMLCFKRFIITYTGSNWSITDYKDLSNSGLSQIASGNYLSEVVTDATLTGTGTVDSPLSVVFSASSAVDINFIYGLVPSSTVATPDEDLDITAGKCLCKDATTMLTITAASALSMPTVLGSALANSTSYRLYAYINNADANAWHLSTSLTPTIADIKSAGAYRWICSFITVADGDIVPFYSVGSGLGLNVLYKASLLDLNSTAVPNSATDLVLSVPLLIKVMPILNVLAYQSSASASDFYIQNKNTGIICWRSDSISDGLGRHESPLISRAIETDTAGKIQYGDLVRTDGDMDVYTRGYYFERTN
jgi:hypothetical protein